MVRNSTNSSKRRINQKAREDHAYAKKQQKVDDARYHQLMEKDAKYDGAYTTREEGVPPAGQVGQECPANETFANYAPGNNIKESGIYFATYQSAISTPATVK
jgi:hypothetical protein